MLQQIDRFTRAVEALAKINKELEEKAEVQDKFMGRGREGREVEAFSSTME